MYESRSVNKDLVSRSLVCNGKDKMCNCNKRSKGVTPRQMNNPNRSFFDGINFGYFDRSRNRMEKVEETKEGSIDCKRCKKEQCLCSQWLFIIFIIRPIVHRGKANGFESDSSFFSFFFLFFSVIVSFFLFSATIYNGVRIFYRISLSSSTLLHIRNSVYSTPSLSLPICMEVGGLISNLSYFPSKLNELLR